MLYSMADGSATSITAIAAATVVVCSIATYQVHSYTPLLWPQYARLTRKKKIAWCNRIVSAAHAAFLVCFQIPSLRDPVMLADPLHAVSERHYFWASVLVGYFAYDAVYMLFADVAAGFGPMLLHHVLGLACCFFGIYGYMGYFGATIQVVFESTTPLLHAVGCLKLMGLEKSRAHAVAGAAFAVQFFVCRILLGGWLLQFMARTAAQAQPQPHWAWAGVALYAALCALNAYWFQRICVIIWRQVTGAKPAEKIKAPGSFRSPHIGQLLAMRARFKRQADKLHRAASAEGTGSTDTELISAHKGSRVSVGMLNSGHLQAMYMRHI